jgi:hypothetical protein
MPETEVPLGSPRDFYRARKELAREVERAARYLTADEIRACVDGAVRETFPPRDE